LVTVEILATGDESPLGTATMRALAGGATAEGMKVSRTNKYVGQSDWLGIWGPGHVERGAARVAQLENGKKVACWDIGYVHSHEKENPYMRVSVNHLHPRGYLLERTPSVPTRWNAHNIELREDADPAGHVVVIGLGVKSRESLNIHNWELKHLRDTQLRFPDRRVLYRPKPQLKRDPHILWEPRDGFSPIEDVLRGASLVICRHSNVAVDACIAGIPVECEDGAAHWLYSRYPNPTKEQRLDFLCRLAHWQWTCLEMQQAWRFLQKVSASL